MVINCSIVHIRGVGVIDKRFKTRTYSITVNDQIDAPGVYFKIREKCQKLTNFFNKKYFFFKNKTYVYLR